MTPVMVLVPLGALLGPRGAGLLSHGVLGYLDVVTTIALATLGVFIGIAAGTQRGRVRRLMAAASAEGAATLMVVALSLLALLVVWAMPIGLPPAIVAAALAVSAAPSAAPFTEEVHDRARQVAARVADLDDVLPIVVGAVVLSLAGAGERPALTDLVLTLAAGAAVGVSGWLLFERAEGAERGVFVAGTLALLGGCAAYLGTSPMLAGLTAGYIWARTPGHTDRIAAADLRKFEHPLVVLLLIIAGAWIEPTLLGVWLLAPYVVFRTAGKLVGGWVASRVSPGVAPADLGAYLLPHGVFGIAFVLNLQQVAPDVTGPLVFAVALGAVVTEVMAVIVTPVPHRA
jgi:hypothetical protein